MASFAKIIVSGGGRAHSVKLADVHLSSIPDFITHVFVHNKAVKEMVKSDRKTEVYDMVFEADIFKMYNGNFKSIFLSLKIFFLENIISYILIDANPNETISTPRNIVNDYQMYVNSKS